MKLILIGIFILFSNSAAISQMLTVDDCVNAFKKDTSFLKTLPTSKQLPIISSFKLADSYGITMKSNLTTESFHKVIFNDTTQSFFEYGFNDNEQYNLFRDELKTSKFNLRNSLNDRRLGAKGKFYFYSNRKAFVSITELYKPSPGQNKYAIQIRNY